MSIGTLEYETLFRKFGQIVIFYSGKWESIISTAKKFLDGYREDFLLENDSET